MALFETLEIIKAALNRDIEIVNPNPQNEVYSHELAQALHIYNRVYKYLPGSEPYAMLLHKIFLPFIDLPYSQTKPYYERYKVFFNNFLYIDGVGLVADHLVQVI